MASTPRQPAGYQASSGGSDRVSQPATFGWGAAPAPYQPPQSYAPQPTAMQGTGYAYPQEMTQNTSPVAQSPIQSGHGAAPGNAALAGAIMGEPNGLVSSNPTPRPAQPNQTYTGLSPKVSQF